MLLENRDELLVHYGEQKTVTFENRRFAQHTVVNFNVLRLNSVAPIRKPNMVF